jgi:hypothetical protein
MEIKGKRLLVCNCEVSMALDGKGLARALGAPAPCDVHTQLCRAQIGAYRDALAEGGPLLVGCTQEAPLFEETRAELGPESEVLFTNIRERAGWAEQGGSALPKISALLAEAALDMPPTPSVAMRSEGECLIYGRDELAIEAAKQLGKRLSVVVLLTGREEVIPPRLMDVPIFRGTITRAAGHLGAFEVEIDDHAAAVVSSRAALAFERSRDSVRLPCDLILDLAGGAPLFPAHTRRDGYLKPDVGNPAEVQRALFDLTDLVGEFEKPAMSISRPICAPIRGAGGSAARAASRSARPPRSARAATWSRSTPICAAAAAPATASARRERRATPIRLRRHSWSACAPCFRPIGRRAARAPRSWSTTTPMAAS